MSRTKQEKAPYTDKQGQYLAFIHQYIKLNRTPPAHTDFQQYFKVTPPTVNQMIKTLEREGLIEKQPGAARSLKLIISSSELPELR